MADEKMSLSPEMCDYLPFAEPMLHQDAATILMNARFRGVASASMAHEIARQGSRHNPKPGAEISDVEAYKACHRVYLTRGGRSFKVVGVRPLPSVEAHYKSVMSMESLSGTHDNSFLARRTW